MYHLVFACAFLGFICPFDAHKITCEKKSYPPKESNKVAKSIFDLDLPPKQRWANIVKDKRPQINDLFEALVTLDKDIFHGYLFFFVDKYMVNYDKLMPYPFNEEIRGIAEATGLNTGRIVLYNIFYEIFTVCTSIIAIDKTSSSNADPPMYHVRNMDFGLFLGWDPKLHDWTVTEALKPLVIALDVRRNNKTLYQAVTFAGYVGVLTAMKPGAFSLTINERFSFDGGFMGLIRWFMGNTNANWISFLTRDLMEKAQDFKDAKSRLEKTSLIAPVYFIIGGVKPSEANVITRARTHVVNERSINVSDPSQWYLLETNYDWWKKPLPFDNRRAPAKQCLAELKVEQNVNFDGLYNVLSTRPILNKLTVYTTLMNVRDGSMETYLRSCPDPCPPW